MVLLVLSGWITNYMLMLPKNLWRLFFSWFLYFVVNDLKPIYSVNIFCPAAIRWLGKHLSSFPSIGMLIFPCRQFLKLTARKNQHVNAWTFTDHCQSSLHWKASAQYVDPMTNLCFYNTRIMFPRKS